MKKPQLHLVCDNDMLRPSLNYCFVNTEDVVVTNAQVLVKHKTSQIFGEEFVEKMKELGHAEIYIHRKELALLMKYDTYGFDLMQTDVLGLVISYIAKKEIAYAKVLNADKFFESAGMFPSYNAVIPDMKDSKDLHRIGVDHSFLNIVGEALGAKNVILTFTGREKAILVHPNQGDYDGIGLVMPVVILK